MSLNGLLAAPARLERRVLGPRAFLIIVLLIIIPIVSYAEGLRLGAHLPIRTIVALCLFLGVSIQAHAEGTRIIHLRLGRQLVAVWGTMLVSILVARYINGGDLNKTLREIAGRHFTAFAIFLAIVYFARGRRNYEFLARFILFTVFLSSIVGLLQWLQIGWAARLPMLLNATLDPLEGDAVMEAGNPMGSATLIQGLYASSHYCGYYVAVGVSMALVLILARHRRWTAIVQLLVIGTTLIVLQQRAAVLAFAVCLSVIAYRLLRSRRARFQSTMLLLVVLLVGSYGVSKWISHMSTTRARYGIDRFGTFLDQRRIDVAKLTLELSGEYWLVGTPIPKYEARFHDEFPREAAPMSPHNLFLNALLFYGGIGLLITIAITALYLRLAWRVWRMAWPRGDYVSIGCVLGLWSWLVCAQFHNPSFLNGDYLGWCLVGLLIASLENYRYRPAQYNLSYAR